MLRGGQRTFFAILCVAVGVAALVALQSLSASIADTLTGDIKSRAGGDITARSTLPSGSDNPILSSETATALDKLKTEGRVVDWTVRVTRGIQIKGYFSFPPTLHSVDPARFPLYGKVEMVEPVGGDFRQLLSAPDTVILSKYLWDKNDYRLGQEIEVSLLAGNSSGQTARLRIVGVVKADVPGITFDAGQIFGFALTANQTAVKFLNPVTNSNANADSNTVASYVYLKTPPGTDNAALVRQLNDQAGIAANSQLYDARTAEQLQEQISNNLEIVNSLLSYVGLLAILIGGIGVINTMLVVIGRRTTEIATVKALGLKSRQTMALFTLEAIILGVSGSMLGVVLGVGLGFAIKGVAEGLFFRPLNWGFYPGPIIIGLLVGILTAGVFGFLPSYAAARVKPAIVLRQQSGGLPRLGGWATVLIILLMTLALGLVCGILLKDLMVGIIVSFVTLLVLLLATGLMWLAVLLTGKLPAPFGPSFKMALRSFSRHRGRTATTLLVMSTGLFFITFIVIIADSIKTSFRETFDLNLGFNVVAFNLQSGQTEQLQSSILEIHGVKQVFAGNSVQARIDTINGNQPQVNPTPAGRTPGSAAVRGGRSITLSGRSLANGQNLSPNGPQAVVDGRTFGPGDEDRRVLIATQEDAERLGLKVSDRLVIVPQSQNALGTGVSRPGNPLEFELIGIVTKGNSTANFEGGLVAPYRAVAGAGAQFSFFYMLIDRAQIKPALTAIQSRLLGGFVFDLGDLINTFTQILDQVLAFPLLLSLLSLFSGAILIANNVALAMLERRTEIGVLKAIGAKRRRVFNILLWESSLVGLLGGLLGVGSGIGIALLIPVLTRAVSPRNTTAIPISWSPLTAGLLLGLGIALAIIATLISAWGAVQEKPLVVLRYE